MLGIALWVSSVVAVAIGLAHTFYVYRQETNEFRTVLARHPVAIRWRAAYYALWTLVLWLLLGATVVLYWAIALVSYLIAKMLRVARSPRAQTIHGADTSS